MIPKRSCGYINMLILLKQCLRMRLQKNELDLTGFKLMIKQVTVMQNKIHYQKATVRALGKTTLIVMVTPTLPVVTVEMDARTVQAETTVIAIVSAGRPTVFIPQPLYIYYSPFDILIHLP